MAGRVPRPESVVSHEERKMIEIVLMDTMSSQGAGSLRSVMAGTTLGSFLQTVYPSGLHGRIVRVGSIMQPSSYVLQAGDRVVIMPTKIEGA